MRLSERRCRSSCSNNKINKLHKMLYNTKGKCMAKTVSAAYAKANLGSLLDQVEKSGERISITRYN